MSNYRKVGQWRWTEHEVFRRLYHVFPSPAYTRLPQVRNGTGFARKQERTADGIVVSTYPSRGLWMAGIEIKVSRSDWKHELARPDKASEIQQYCNYWYVAAPSGIVPPEEVPEAWGLIEVQKNTAVIVKAAPKTECKPPDMLLLCSMLRQAESCTVPKDEVEEMIASARQESIDEARTHAERYTRLLDLEHRMEVFQEKSGLSLMEDNGDSMGWWRVGNIAEAVKVIVEAGSPDKALQKLRDDYAQIMRIGKKIGDALEQNQ